MQASAAGAAPAAAGGTVFAASENVRLRGKNNAGQTTCTASGCMGRIEVKTQPAGARLSFRPRAPPARTPSASGPAAAFFQRATQPHVDSVCLELPDAGKN
jgi:hypothetical protein